MTVDLPAVVVIDDLETLRLLSDPLRVRLLEVLALGRGAPRTVKWMARELGVSATKLYYHVNLLEERGLLRVAESRVVSGIIEKSYVPAAHSFRVDPSLFSLGSEGLQATARSFATLLNNVAAEIATGLETGDIEVGHDAAPARKLTGFRSLARMSPSRVAEFKARLDELLAEFDSADTDSSPDDPTYGLVVAHYPVSGVGEDDAEASDV